MTALHAETMHSDEWLVLKLLRHGANVNGKTRQCATPLHIAAENGSVNSIFNLLLFGADVRIRSIYNHTPKDVAVLCGRSNFFFRELEEYTSNVNKLSDTGDTFLYAASRFCLMSRVSELTHQGAYVNKCNITGYTPLHVAIFSNQSV